jgi:glutathione S-transferase
VKPLQIIGRRSSHFTRLTRIFAEELGVPYELVPIYDMTELDPAVYGGHPMMKLPILRSSDGVVFGAENICRALADHVADHVADHAASPARIVWPEQLHACVSRNAQELVWSCMAAQVQIVFGTLVAKLPADNLYFQKARAGFEGALAWLDAHVTEALALLPAQRQLSLFEASLFCMVEHLRIRPTIPVDKYTALQSFAQMFGQRPSAQKTPYEFDVRPGS